MSNGGQPYILYGRPGSGSSACEAVLTLMGLDFQSVDFQMRSEGTLPPEIFALNPLGQVPVLVLPDGSVMTESAAIIIHLADLDTSKGIAPKIGDADRALYLRSMLFMATNIYMTDLRWYYPQRYTADPSHVMAIKAVAGREQLRNWTALEDMVSGQISMLPSGFSAVDLYLTMLISWTELSDFAQQFPKLWRIFTRCRRMPELAQIWARHGIAN